MFGCCSGWQRNINEQLPSSSRILFIIIIFTSPPNNQTTDNQTTLLLTASHLCVQETLVIISPLNNQHNYNGRHLSDMSMTCSWNCCDCQSGPHNLDLHSCLDCGSMRCDDCPIQPTPSVNNNQTATMHSCSHELPAFPSAPSQNCHATMSSPLRSSSPGINFSTLDYGLSLPQGAGAPVPGAKKHDTTYMYLCCKCRDGPKVYNVQPQCIICEHISCPECVVYAGK